MASIFETIGAIPGTFVQSRILQTIGAVAGTYVISRIFWLIAWKWPNSTTKAIVLNVVSALVIIPGDYLAAIHAGDPNIDFRSGALLYGACQILVFLMDYARVAPQQTKKAKWPAFAGIALFFAIMVGQVIGRVVVEYVFGADLMALAGELNKKLPTMLDSETRMDTVDASSDRVLFSYTLVNHKAEEFDAAYFVAVMRPELIRQTCTIDTMMRNILKRNIVVGYSYSSSDGKHIATIDVHPADCTKS
jgi:hypothetical protein